MTMNKLHSITCGELAKSLAGLSQVSQLDNSVRNIASKNIIGIALNHQDLQPGWLFVALGSIKDGGKQHGLDYLAEIKAKSPLAVLVDTKDARASRFIGDSSLHHNLPIIKIDDLRSKLPQLGRLIYNEDDLQWIGITGTNGKSSVAHILGDGLTKLGSATAVIGTVYNGFSNKQHRSSLDSSLSTPDILSLRRYGYEFKRQGAKYVALECSSHGLSQHRTDGLNISCGVFTNLSNDHLDYHKDINDYEKSKYRLFEYPSIKYAVINYADPVGVKWYKQLEHKIECLSYGGDSSKGADLYADAVAIGKEETSAVVYSPMGKGKLKVKNCSYWGMSNSLAALGVMLHLDFDFQDSLHVLSAVTPLDGRMQKISYPDMPDFVVDYAHSPDALEQTLISAKQQLAEPGKLWVVFGCGGERDRSKRKLMGAVADKYADKIILTNDNPRGEEPATIIENIMAGVRNRDVVAIQDRGDAIIFALAQATKDDLVLVAGKGHEKYQEIMGTQHYFNDYEFISDRIKHELG